MKTIQIESDSDEEATITYSLEGMSAKEIFDECMYYFTIPPQEGVTHEDVVTLIRANPVNKSSSRYSFASNYDPAFGQSSITKSIQGNYIQGITIESEQRMDGKINIKTGVIIDMILNDYNIASELYDMFYEYLSPQYHSKYGNPGEEFGRGEINLKEGVNWYARGYYDDYNTFDYLKLEKHKDIYHLIVEDRK